MHVAETIQFQGDRLVVARDEAGRGWVAVRPICDALGIQSHRQQEKLTADLRFSWTHMRATGSDGKQYSMFALPIDQLNGWLFTINSNKVKPESRERLLAYQQECMAVLFRHFMPQGGTGQEVLGMFRALQADISDIRSIATRQQDEIDELKTLLHLYLTNTEEAELRAKIQEVKTALKMDGRTIVGHLRKTFGVSSPYTVPGHKMLINHLNVMMGKGLHTVK